MLIQLEDLRQHAASLAQLDETERALSLLHALIYQSIERYPDTLQHNELPQFVNKCTKAFTQIIANAQGSVAIQEHCRILLRLSFDAEGIFTSLLTDFLEQLCLGERDIVGGRYVRTRGRGLKNILMRVRIEGRMFSSCLSYTLNPIGRKITSSSLDPKARAIG